MKRKKLPERTVERLSEYRRTLLPKAKRGVTHVYSHVLADIHGITAVQVRRDLMLIGFSSDTKKGYNVKELIEFISNVLDSEEQVCVGIIGMGHLGRAVTAYFNDKRAKLKIIASFDVNPEKVGATIAGVPCYDVSDLEERIKSENLSILLLTLPPDAISEIAPKIKDSNIKGVLNFTNKPLTTLEGSDIWVEDYDIITKIEKVAYFTKNED